MGRMEEIHPEHPRAESLRIRRRLVEGFEAGLVVPEGLSAHGRGEAFDYLLGEVTTSHARGAVEASAAALLSAESPTISVNGNTAALVPSDIVRLAEVVEAKIEVNLFHGSPEREQRIARHLRNHGADEVLGMDGNRLTEIPEIKSGRRMVDERGISKADAVLVPLEDGDRTEALVKLGKMVIAIDLNPMSRTAQAADITVVDNVVRALPLMVREGGRLSNSPSEELGEILQNFDNGKNLRSTIGVMLDRLEGLSGN